ncbi:enoyl-CoA hydratase-related protein [Moraxella nasovis]|uniref:enoyl-CoA hydratase-related protein n=1 Tax=Moraxella nasovis TaxID=2904121 RepID=UPI001F60964A|nr:enoyl-CoA hydratase-related protein [Moraxella nasovis]UNU74038.1 enoyl-CoA hydratase-related protein [Moraxella nasovis]
MGRQFNFIQCVIKGAVARVWVNRPEVHNAFNAVVIRELHDCFEMINESQDIRVVVLGGRGKSFSAGADASWMKKAGEASMDDNHADALCLAAMLNRLATLRQPTIARVQGAALGGGMGLASACDMCVATTRAIFATSEVRLGLAPSTISPYVIRAIGTRQASRYFLTAERITADVAWRIGLVHEVVDDEVALDETIDHLIAEILKGAPKAQAQSKVLINMVAHDLPNNQMLDKTAMHIAALRTGDEAKAGLQAFLSKQTPPWVID